MPEPLIEFFVKFLTDPGDVVFDPFAGSNTTGSVAERLGTEVDRNRGGRGIRAGVAGQVPGSEAGGLTRV